jgi:sialic acid synthase SpsE
MGSPDKTVVPSEVPVRERLAKSVVAAQPIAAGTVLLAEHLTAKGPGDGIPANHLARLIGRVAAIDVPLDTLLPREALEWHVSPLPVGEAGA